MTGLLQLEAGLVARVLVAVLLGGFVLALSRRAIESSIDLVNRASLVVAALVLLVPAQYPWYYVWFAPFLPFRPWLGFLILAATIPLYYAYFHLVARERPEVFEDIVVWIIWAPVWAALVLEAARSRWRERAV